MSALANLGFKEIRVVDFEFGAERGERPVPICLVALELLSRRKWELWQGELQQLSAAPYNTGPDSLVVAYYASAVMGCHLALGWALLELGRDAKARALQQLEQAGLVTVAKTPGRNPRMTVLEMPE